MFRKYHINEELARYHGFEELSDEQIETIKKIVVGYSLALWKPFTMQIKHQGEDTTRIFQRWARLLLSTKN
ncbi:MAG: hypothetical protein VW862_05025, partial [Euryarchaeota archaeon]